MSAEKYGVPGAPVFFWAEQDQLLPAIFAREDDLLLERTLHEFTSSTLPGFVFINFYKRGRWLGPQEATSHIRATATRSTKLDIRLPLC
jgi:hypothetical protein